MIDTVLSFSFLWTFHFAFMESTSCSWLQLVKRTILWGTHTPQHVSVPRYDSTSPLKRKTQKEKKNASPAMTTTTTTPTTANNAGGDNADADADADIVKIDAKVVASEFCSTTADKSLRVTCYGSSSAKTPELYLDEARSLGYTLARRGHVCVNGAGSYGCMAAMNDGAMIGNGHIIGVIHEMFLVDGGYWGDPRGAHKAFTSTRSATEQTKSSSGSDGPIREILVAGGDDLQERKKLLVHHAEALVVLPGGPGTWDELWEMACARHLGLVKMPIVCINVNGYYDPFRIMLERAYGDKLIRLRPEQIVHFATTSENAIKWIENEVKQQQIQQTDKEEKEAASSSNKGDNKREQPAGDRSKNSKKQPKRLPSSLKRSSFYSPPPMVDDDDDGIYNNTLKSDTTDSSWFTMHPTQGMALVGLSFVVGAVSGWVVSSSRR